MSVSADEVFKRLQAAGAAQNRPPVEQWHPQHRGSINIRIDEAGQWWHEGSRFRRDRLVSLFAQILRREEDRYYLVTPVEMLQIEVADVPFIAIDLDVRGTPGDTDLLFTTNVGDIVTCDASHPIVMRSNKPYVEVRNGLEARLTTAVYYRLADYAVPGAGEPAGGNSNPSYVVYSQGCAFSLDS